MHVSIIIVNFNTPDVTVDCLKSICKFHKDFNFTYEIILVDNAPRTAYKTLFVDCVPNLTYIHSSENIGFGRANNLGMEVAKGHYFLLLNSDTLLIDNSINNSIDFLKADFAEKIGLLGCKLLNEDLSYQHSFYPFTDNSLWDYFKSNNPILNKLFKTNLHFTERNIPTKVGDVSGAFMLLRAVVYKEIKGFDPDFFLYCEETEWCRNRIAKKYDIYFFPDTHIIHLGGKSAPRNQMAIQAAISEYLFWYKCGLAHCIAFWGINSLNLISHIAIYPFSKNRTNLTTYLEKYFIATKYAILDIPKYTRKFGARKKALYYKAAEQTFFGNANDN